MMQHRQLCFGIALATAVSAFADTRQETAPLHQRIDKVIAATHFGALAGTATDAEFLRRCYLDLAGRSPTSEEAKSFLADTMPDKRAVLVDKLLAADEFNDCFAVVLDLMLMERRGGSRIPQEQWKAFLRGAVAGKQPFDQIVRSILIADGTGDSRGAVKFLVEREVEPNALTRDVGRIFLGRDLQCAQCHDHPNIGDYLQAEYYGLLAFVNRSYLFEDEADNKQAYVGEKAEGTTEFKSVFSPNDDVSRTMPQLLDGLTLDVEPRLDGEEAYVVAPAKNAAGVPKFSRRAQLARLLTHPANEHFAKNVANRLWAHMMGRGIVDPVDFHHGDNPPSHPELLKLLADEFVALKFDIREFLRQIALSDTYQRSIEFPEEAAVSLPELDDRAEQITAEITKLEANVLAEEQARARVASQLKSARSSVLAADDAITECVRQLGDLTKQRDELQKGSQHAQQQLTEKQQQFDVMSAAVATAKKVADALPKDTALAGAHAEYQRRADKLSEEVEAIKKSIADHQQKLAALGQQLAATNRELAGLKSQRMGLVDMVAEARGAVEVFAARRRERESLSYEKRQQIAAIELQRDCLAKRQSQQDLAKQLAAFEGRSTASQTACQELEVSLASSEQEVAAKHAEIEVLVQATDAAEASLTEQAAASAVLKQAIATAKFAADQLSDPTLVESVQALSQQFANLSDQLAAGSDAAEQRAERLAVARKELGLLQANHDKLMIDGDRLAAQAAKLQQAIATAKEAHEAAVVQTDLTGKKLRKSWERRCVVRSLKPLTPEQLAGSTIAALGLKTRFQIEAEHEWANKNKDKQPAEIDVQQQQAELAALVGKRVAQVESQYISLFAAPAGAPQDVFSSTADQALFFANDGSVQNWLSPAEGTLLNRLQSMDDAHQIAEELHLAILSRPVEEIEKKEVTEYLARRKDDRQKAIQELAWGLLSSLEFRFSQ